MTNSKFPTIAAVQNIVEIRAVTIATWLPSGFREITSLQYSCIHDPKSWKLACCMACSWRMCRPVRADGVERDSGTAGKAG